MKPIEIGGSKMFTVWKIVPTSKENNFFPSPVQIASVRVTMSVIPVQTCLMMNVIPHNTILLSCNKSLIYLRSVAWEQEERSSYRNLRIVYLWYLIYAN